MMTQSQKVTIPAVHWNVTAMPWKTCDSSCLYVALPLQQDSCQRVNMVLHASAAGLVNKESNCISKPHN